MSQTEDANAPAKDENAPATQDNPAEETTQDKDVPADSATAAPTEATKEENGKDEDVKVENKEEETPAVTLPSTRKAVIITGYNEDVLKVMKLVELPVPKPVKTEVLVKVDAASINPVDWKIAKGWLEPVMKIKFPRIMGRDCSGTVVACGPDCKRVKVGMRVAAMARGDGTLTEYALLTEEVVAELPDNVNSIDGASIPLVSITSYQALTEKGKLAKGNKVLIFGGSTATGIFGIQIAKAFEASEIVVTSSQEELCKSLGATKVYNYKNKDHDWFKDLQGKDFDIIYDCVGGKEYWEKGQKILHKNGRFVTIVGDTTHGEKMTIGALISGGFTIAGRKFWGAMGYPNYDVFFADARRSLPQVMELCKQNKLKTMLDKDTPFSLDNYQNAFKKSMDHTARGKLVVEIKGGVVEKLEDTRVVTKTEKTETTETASEKKDDEASDQDATMKSAANGDADATSEPAKDEAAAAATDAKETEATDAAAGDNAADTQEKTE